MDAEIKRRSVSERKRVEKSGYIYIYIKIIFILEREGDSKKEQSKRERDERSVIKR